MKRRWRLNERTAEHRSRPGTALRYDQLKILLVDDNRHMRFLLSEILRAVGIKEILEAGDGAEGLKIMRMRSIDVVITDLTMQPMDGIEFVRRLRSAPDSPAPLTPIIMITGHSTVARVREARDAGVNEFMAKPLSARGILDRLHRVTNDPRRFVRSEQFTGPDRRRRAEVPLDGVTRRAADRPGS